MQEDYSSASFPGSFDGDGMYAEGEVNPARILEEAVEAVCGDRNESYGDPWENHNRTADLWNWWIEHANRDLPKSGSIDVCMMNILQKISRLANDPTHEDSWRDIAGYAANAVACLDQEAIVVLGSPEPPDEIGEL